MDERRQYIGQLLRKYKTDIYSPNMYTVGYQLCDGKEDYKFFGHNDGIEFAIQYIEELENKLDELQYIERIIKLAERC